MVSSSWNPPFSGQLGQVSSTQREDRVREAKVANHTHPGQQRGDVFFQQETVGVFIYFFVNSSRPEVGKSWILHSKQSLENEKFFQVVNNNLERKLQ
jgi:hypothetical protein